MEDGADHRSSILTVVVSIHASKGTRPPRCSRGRWNWRYREQRTNTICGDDDESDDEVEDEADEEAEDYGGPLCIIDSCCGKVVALVVQRRGIDYADVTTHVCGGDDRNHVGGRAFHTVGCCTFHYLHCASAQIFCRCRLKRSWSLPYFYSCHKFRIVSLIYEGGRSAAQRSENSEEKASRLI